MTSKNLVKRKINDFLQVLGVQLVRLDTLHDLERRYQESDTLREYYKRLVKNQVRYYWNIRDMVAESRLRCAQIRCPVCELEQPESLFKSVRSSCTFGGGSLDRMQCPNCELVWGPMKIMELTEEEMALEYENHYTVYEEGDSTSNELRAFYELDPNPKGVYVNFGSGRWSRSGELLRAQGWKVLDYDPHSLVSYGDLKYRFMSWGELARQQVDGVYSNNVLEHLRDPVGVLRSLATVVKKGGKMVHATPCWEYCYEFTRFHVMFYVGKSGRMVFENAGWEISSQTWDGEYRSVVVTH